jgi:hypothetical protein
MIRPWAVASVVAVWGAWAAEAARGDGGAYMVVLKNALPGDKPLTVCLDAPDGAVRAAFATATTFNRTCHDVDASGLKIQRGKLAGPIKVTLYSDGYVPKEDKFACQYELDCAVVDGKVSGSYTGRYGLTEMKGEVSGEAQPHAPLQAARIEMNMENAIQTAKSKKGGARRLKVTMAMHGGEWFGGRADPPGSITDVGFGAIVQKTDMKLDDGKLTGTVRVLVKQQGGGSLTFDYALDAAVIGPSVAGSFKTTIDGKEGETGRFMGKVTSELPNVGECLHTLVLHDALKEGGFVKLYLAARDGKYTGGFGATPNFNNATHEIDATGLSIEAGAVRGTVKVTVHPDPWIPQDHKPIPCEFTIDARIRDAEVMGGYEGTAGDKTVKGPMDGGLDARPEAGAVARMTLKLENGLAGGNPFANRAFLGCEVKDGKIVGGKVGNNHTSLSGTVDSGDVKIEGDALSVTATATIPEGGGVWAGKYSFTVKGIVVGRIAAGSFETVLEGKGKVKTGRFWGTISDGIGK